MGVPKFFRYISERYPCLSELAREESIPEFDNLYLDVNGIVHNCSHPDDGNIHFHLEERQIFQDIFNYLDKLFYLIKPQKLFFLAIDGVAPRAKMNQQRSRRFRSAREADQLEAKALQRGEKRMHERFDNNCITPGTVFMERLHKRLRAFLRTKLSTDALWQKCTVILSGQEVPGEGEHKIMDYIRYMKAQPNFDSKTRHCLYGLDADLIILGLCTHELHFVVLREEVKFGRNVKRASIEETRFFLLHLGLLREYLELEFAPLSTPDHKLDVAKLIDDWILMGFLVGNDFVPNLPCLHITSNALPMIYQTYMKIYPQLGGNINENGKLNLHRLEIFLNALSDTEIEIFVEHYDDFKYINKNEAFDIDIEELKNGTSASINEDLAALIDQSRKMYEDDSEDDSNEENADLKKEFRNYKMNYYRNKFKDETSFNLVEDLTHHYVTALQWILDYYYMGVQSWSWYYPYHYAPFISDLKNISKIEFDYKMGKPFLPFQQLLAVLPGASSKLLPTPYHRLMLSENSPLADFYPVEFETDLNGKKHDWEAIVLIPFIDEKRLISAMNPFEQHLTSEERERNKHGPMYQYDYTAESLGPMPGIEPIKALKNVFCTEVERWSDELLLNLPRSIYEEAPNAARHVFFPGFPTMSHLEFDYALRFERMKVFEQPSRNQSMILMPKKRDLEDTIEAVAGQYLGQVVYIGWPHLIKGKVEYVATATQIIDSSGIQQNDSHAFQMDCKSLDDHFIGRMGIKFNNYDVLVYVRTYAGTTVDFGQHGNVFMKDAWHTTEIPYPAQGVVSNIKVQDKMHSQFASIAELFPVGSTIFFIGNPYCGSEGTVLDPNLVYSCGRVQVSICVGPEPDLKPARCKQTDLDKNYVASYTVCKELGISSKCLGRLTGTVWVVLGPRREKMENVSKHNIALQLKYPRLNEERAGYCRRINNQWFYTNLTVDLINEYSQRFPEVLNYFRSSNDFSEFIYEEDIFPNSMGEHLIEDVANWVRQQPHMKVDRVTCGSKTICKETVELLLTAVEDLRSMPVKTVKLQVKPHLLVKPNVTLASVYKSPRAIRLFDRIVIVRTIYMVPVGTTGTVIGIHPVTDPNPVRLECLNSVETFCEILFDKCVPNCTDIHGLADERVYTVPESALVLINMNATDNKQQQAAERQQQQQPQHLDIKPHQQKQQQQGAQMEQQPQPSSSWRQSTNSNANATRSNWRQQQQPQAQVRYKTAASDKFTAITMKANIPNEFVKPSTMPAEQPKSNWRNQCKQMPVQQQQKASSPPIAENREDRSKGGYVMPTNISTPHDQTQALKMLLGMKPADQTQTQPKQQAQQTQQLHLQPQILQPEPNLALPSQSLSLPYGQTPMPKLPKPPLFWQQDALKHQAKSQLQEGQQQQKQQQQQLHQQLQFPQQQQQKQRPQQQAQYKQQQQQFKQQQQQQPQFKQQQQMQVQKQPQQYQQQQQQQQQQQKVHKQPKQYQPQQHRHPLQQQSHKQQQQQQQSHKQQQQQQSHKQQQQQHQQHHEQQQQTPKPQQLQQQYQLLQHQQLHKQHKFQQHQQQPMLSLQQQQQQQPPPHSTNEQYCNNGNNGSNINPNINKSRRYQTSIQDFVPIQAYRPKVSSQRIQSSANVEKPMDKSEGATGLYTDPAIEMASVSSVSKRNDESVNKLMEALKISSTNTTNSSADVITVNADEKPSNVIAQPKVTRKPRVPRIGAKFDLEYVLPEI